MSSTNYEIGVVNYHIGYYNQRALSWYCYHLFYYQEYNDLNCVGDNLSKKTHQAPQLIGWDEPNDYFIYLILFYILLGCFFVCFLLFLVILSKNWWWNTKLVLFIRKICLEKLICLVEIRRKFCVKNKSKLFTKLKNEDEEEDLNNESKELNEISSLNGDQETA